MSLGFPIQGKAKLQKDRPSARRDDEAEGLGAGAAAAYDVVSPFSGIGAKNTGTILEGAVGDRKMV